MRPKNRNFWIERDIVSGTDYLNRCCMITMIDIIPIEDVKETFKRSRLVEHHTKYKEIHGEDKTIFIPHGQHITLHRRLRKEGKCKIPSEELRKISSRACRRKKSNLLKDVDKRVKERVLNIKTVL
jgi:hypothetical protein